jgi:hypothetical protein
MNFNKNNNNNWTRPNGRIRSPSPNLFDDDDGELLHPESETNLYSVSSGFQSSYDRKSDSTNLGYFPSQHVLDDKPRAYYPSEEDEDSDGQDFIPRTRKKTITRMRSSAASKNNNKLVSLPTNNNSSRNDRDIHGNSRHNNIIGSRSASSTPDIDYIRNDRQSSNDYVPSGIVSEVRRNDSNNSLKRLTYVSELLDDSDDDSKDATTTTTNNLKSKSNSLHKFNESSDDSIESSSFYNNNDTSSNVGDKDLEVSYSRDSVVDDDDGDENIILNSVTNSNKIKDSTNYLDSSIDSTDISMNSGRDHSINSPGTQLESPTSPHTYIYNNYKKSRSPIRSTIGFSNKDEIIDMKLLRDAYDNNLHRSRLGADRINLSRAIRIQLSAPCLADDILGLETSAVLWNILEDLVSKYKTINGSNVNDKTITFEKENNVKNINKLNNDRNEINYSIPKQSKRTGNIRFSASSFFGDNKSDDGDESIEMPSRVIPDETFNIKLELDKSKNILLPSVSNNSIKNLVSSPTKSEKSEANSSVLSLDVSEISILNEVVNGIVNNNTFDSDEDDSGCDNDINHQSLNKSNEDTSKMCSLSEDEGDNEETSNNNNLPLTNYNNITSVITPRITQIDDRDVPSSPSMRVIIGRKSNLSPYKKTETFPLISDTSPNKDEFIINPSIKDDSKGWKVATSDLITNKSDLITSESDLITNISDGITNKSDLITNKSDLIASKSDSVEFINNDININIVKENIILPDIIEETKIVEDIVTKNEKSNQNNDINSKIKNNIDANNNTNENENILEIENNSEIDDIIQNKIKSFIVKKEEIEIEGKINSAVDLSIDNIDNKIISKPDVENETKPPLAGQLSPKNITNETKTNNFNASSIDATIPLSSSSQIQPNNIITSPINNGVTFKSPPLSEFAIESGVILEGWLEKKSGLTGLWLKVG